MTLQAVRHGDVEPAYQVRESRQGQAAPAVLLIMGIDHQGELAK